MRKAKDYIFYLQEKSLTLPFGDFFHFNCMLAIEAGVCLRAYAAALV
jgi:hypothetical protein